MGEEFAKQKSSRCKRQAELNPVDGSEIFLPNVDLPSNYKVL
jgi:hypothetical protein